MSRLPGENKKKYISFFTYHHCIFFKLKPFANLDIKTSNKDISKTITASSLRLGQLKEDGK